MNVLSFVPTPLLLSHPHVRTTADASLVSEGVERRLRFVLASDREMWYHFHLMHLCSTHFARLLSAAFVVPFTAASHARDSVLEIKSSA